MSHDRSRWFRYAEEKSAGLTTVCAECYDKAQKEGPYPWADGYRKRLVQFHNRRKRYAIVDGVIEER